MEINPSKTLKYKIFIIQRIQTQWVLFLLKQEFIYKHRI